MKKIFSLGILLILLIGLTAASVIAKPPAKAKNRGQGKYVSALTQAGVPSVADQWGIDFGEVFVSPAAHFDGPNPYLDYTWVVMLFDEPRLTTDVIYAINSDADGFEAWWQVGTNVYHGTYTQVQSGGFFLDGTSGVDRPAELMDKRWTVDDWQNASLVPDLLQ